MSSGISVNGEHISEESILKEMQYHRAGEMPWQQAADALVVRCLLLQEANRLQIECTPEQVGPGRFEVEDEALIRGLFEQEVSVTEPDLEACRDYYDENPSEFRSPELFEPRHILYAAALDDADAGRVALEKAHRAIQILQQEPELFDEIARTESDCTSRSSGGHLGQLSLGQTVPEFEKAMLELQSGELYQQPVQTRYGVHVVRMEFRDDGRQLPFESVHQKISDRLAERQWRKAVQNYIRELTTRACITGWTFRPDFS